MTECLVLEAGRKNGYLSNCQMDSASPKSPLGNSASAAVAETPGSPADLSRGVSSVVGHFRLVICALLLFATTKSYMDRNVLS
ncbi:MAG: hypothetical protein ACRD51_09280, partial [Candidatus Acidiferrum sp.]